MTLVNDKIMDDGLNVLTNDVENLYINSAEPATFTAASSTVKLGTKSAPTVGAPANGAVDGRRVTVSAVTNGVVDTNGTGTHWSLTDNSLSLLLATAALSASQVLTAPNPFTLTAFDIGIRDFT